MAKKRVIVDCDPGHDDVVAIAMTHHFADLLAVTTAAGNVPLEMTTRNALVTLQILESAAPVYAGAAGPLSGEVRDASAIHGKGGLGGIEPPPLTRSAADGHAVDYLLRSTREESGDGKPWIVAIGPLTNIALALRLDPSFADRIAGISIMGGGLDFGNATATAEFNIYADPEAAKIVFDAPVRKILAPLDLTHQFRIDDERLERIASISTETASFIAQLLGRYIDSYEREWGFRAGALHDPCALLAITHPELFDVEPLHIDIELTGTLTRGMTVADRRLAGSSPNNCEVLTKIDAPGAFDALLEACAAAR